MRFNEIFDKISNKNNFMTLHDYIKFSIEFLNYIEISKQAVIVSQNETNYNFYQFNEEGKYQVTRPFNSNILYYSNILESQQKYFINLLSKFKIHGQSVEVEYPEVINRVIYTIQQSIGFALDAFPSYTQTARKINGDLFERLILLVLSEAGINCASGVIKVPVIQDGEKICQMSYQQDIIIKQGSATPANLTEEETVNVKAPEVKAIGSVKVTSKDRIDKIFIDKHLYSLLSETQIPHIAVFLHDVQRKSKNLKDYAVNTTFLAGRFKGYTVKLNPLDGVYYFDPRPNMITDNFLKKHIKTFDYLLRSDIWKLLSK